MSRFLQETCRTLSSHHRLFTSFRVIPSDQLITPPVFGELNPKFTDFIAPGMIIAIAFAQSIGLTAMAIVMARLEGTLDRQVGARGEMGIGKNIIFFKHIYFRVVATFSRCFLSYSDARAAKHARCRRTSPCHFTSSRLVTSPHLSMFLCLFFLLFARSGRPASSRARS